MKALNKVISTALIGIITVSAGLWFEAAAAGKTDKAKPSFKAPREVLGYLNVNVAKLSRNEVEQSLWELERLWSVAKTNYENQLNSTSMKSKLAKYRFRDLAQFRNIQDPTVLKLLTDIMADSMRLSHVGQNYRLKINYTAITNQITDNVSKPVADYFRVINRTQNIAPDSALKMLPNELAKRISEAELFLKNNSGFSRKVVIKTIYNECLGIYLLGTTQTPAFTDNKIRNSFLKSYQSTAAKYKDLPFGKTINEYLNLLEKNKYQKTKAVEQFAKKYIR